MSLSGPCKTRGEPQVGRGGHGHCDEQCRGNGSCCYESSRRKTLIQHQGETSSRLDNLAEEMSRVNTHGPEASEIQTSSLGIGRTGHFFQLGDEDSRKASWMKQNLSHTLEGWKQK